MIYLCVGVLEIASQKGLDKVGTQRGKLRSGRIRVIIRAKAKDIQSLGADRIRHEEANRTALEAIGNLKKRKLGDSSDASKVTPSALSLRSRTKRVHVRDLLFLMEQERCLKHSSILFKSYCS